MAAQEKPPLYPTLLGLKHVHPNAWQRAVLGEGMALLGALLAMADLASAWAIVLLPVAMAVVVKSHDLMAGLLAEPPVEGEDEELAELRTALARVRQELTELRKGD